MNISNYNQLILAQCANILWAFLWLLKIDWWQNFRNSLKFSNCGNKFHKTRPNSLEKSAIFCT